MSERERGKKIEEDEEENEINDNKDDQLTTIDRDELIKTVDNLEQIELELIPTKLGKERLAHLVKEGININFLKLILANSYEPLTDELSDINEKLCEYPVSGLVIIENKVRLTFRIMITEDKDLEVRSFGIFLTDEHALERDSYEEFLIALFQRERPIKLSAGSIFQLF